MSSDFSRIITLLRKEKGVTQRKAAEDLGVSQALLSHYEKGIRECGLDFVVRVADYYSVSCDYLLGRSADRSGLTPVSYTHLDVYKRQAPACARALFAILLIRENTSMKHIRKKIAAAVLCAALCLALAGCAPVGEAYPVSFGGVNITVGETTVEAPVSYTHLDVYKRQGVGPAQTLIVQGFVIIVGVALDLRKYLAKK